MSDLQDLLLRWRDGSLSDDERRDLTRLLGQPDQRASAVRHLRDTVALVEALRGEAARERDPVGAATARLRRVGETINALGADAADGAPRPRASRPWTRYRRLTAGLAACILLSLGLALWAHHATVLARDSASSDSASSTAPLGHISITGESTGSWLVHAGSTVEVPVATGMALLLGDRLTSGVGGATLQLAQEATVLALDPASELVITEAPGRRDVRLRSGGISASVAKQPSGRTLRFLTPQAEVLVVGTRFTLAVDADGALTHVAVQEGRVRFQSSSGGAVLEVAATQSALAGPGGVHAAGVRQVRGPLVPVHGCLWGVSLRSEPRALPAEAALEASTHRRMDVVHQYQSFSDFARDRPFPSLAQRQWAAGGRVLAISWKPRLGEAELRWSDVAAGAYDEAYVDVLARKAAAWGQPWFLCLHHDPEDRIGAAGSGMGTADFVRMWRHVHQRFALAGATRVVWVWTMSGDANQVSRWNACYPGDDCVDWLGCSAYNNATTPTALRWRSFSQLVAPFVRWSREEFQGDLSKPIMVSVYACAEDPVATGPSKQDWLREVPAAVRENPEIRAVVYFDDRALRADSTPAALAGFTQAGADPLFQGSLAPGPGAGTAPTP